MQLLSKLLFSHEIPGLEFVWDITLRDSENCYGITRLSGNGESAIIFLDERDCHQELGVRGSMSANTAFRSRIEQIGFAWPRTLTVPRCNASFVGVGPKNGKSYSRRPGCCDKSTPCSRNTLGPWLHELSAR